jgi:hypothetical protein
MRSFGFRRSPSRVAVLAAMATFLAVAPVAAQPADDLFLPALTQRSEGRYDEAAAQLRGIIDAHTDGRATAEIAWQHLFTTLSLNPEPKAAEELAAAIREALGRYPDLAPREEYCPRGIITLVQAVRLQMYGAVEIIRPEGAYIFLDGELKGRSPLLMDFIRVGNRELVIAKDGYKERRETITVEPGARLQRDIELAKPGHTRWYVVGGAAAAGLVWALLSGDDAAEPLPDPPPPPSAR